MIKFRHNVPQVSHQKAYWKRHDGVDSLRWNFEIEPLVVQ
jgi:hypothetical protein